MGCNRKTGQNLNKMYSELNQDSLTLIETFAYIAQFYYNLKQFTINETYVYIRGVRLIGLTSLNPKV